MSIESIPTQQSSTQPVATVQKPEKKKLPADDAAPVDGVGSFSALMSSMLDPLPNSDAATADAPATEPKDATGPYAQTALAAQVAVAALATPATPAALATPATQVTQPDKPQITIHPAADAATAAQRAGQLLAATVDAAASPMGQAALGTAPGKSQLQAAATSAASRQLATADLNQSLNQSLNQNQAQLKETLAHAGALAVVPAADVTGVKLGAEVADILGQLNRPQERKSTLAQAGNGFEGVMGSAITDRLGLSATYEVAPASAVVPDAQVAETVSYWAMDGMQSAELTLDGLGNEPVKVRISVDGDQAQVDFRSNQPEVRQALESASEQLKAMLSGEGLQLTGMSVGSSGPGQPQGEGGQPKPSPRQTKLVSLEPTRAATVRAANLSVGRALDLYV